MNINRRSFIRLGALGIIGSQLPSNTVPFTFNPHPAQVKFLLASDKLYPALYGIPYHQLSGTTGQWLGISRAAYPIKKELFNLIGVLEKDKNKGE